MGLDLPEGMVVRELTRRVDGRGSLVEFFRESWLDSDQPVQWNLVHSEARVLRGLHVHARHTDYLLMAAGSMALGVKDVRRGSVTFGATALLDISAMAPVAVVIPPGVAHGFCFAEPAVHVYGVSEYWNVEDELGCRWDDPQIGIRWPLRDPLLSPRDEEAGDFASMVRDFERRLRPMAFDTGGEPQ